MHPTVSTKKSDSYKNHVNDSSIARTLTESEDSRYPLRLFYGNILCPSVNLTNNECYRFPALHFYQTSGTSRISYCSIVNNTANGGWGCIMITSSLNSIDTCNILNNSQATNDYGAIYTGGNLIIKDSCILGNNKGKKVFYEEASSKKITISNCTIDDDIFTSGRYYGSVTVDITIKRTFINALSHIVTQSCDSYFDLYWTVMNPNVPCLISCNYNFRGFSYFKHPRILKVTY